MKLPAPSSLPAWSHPGHLFLMLGPGFGRQPCLSLPGVPKYATEQTEDGLVLVLAARLVSVCVGWHGYPSLALHSPDLPPLQLHRTQLRWQGPSQPSVQKPGTTLRFPNVSGCFSVGAKEHPPACHSSNFSPCTSHHLRLLLPGPSRAASAPSLREAGTNPARVPRSGPCLWVPACTLLVCLFVCFLGGGEFVYKIDSWPFETNCY